MDFISRLWEYVDVNFTGTAMAKKTPIRDVVRGTIIRVPDADDLWIAPDYFAPWNKHPYRHFKMMKLRSADINGPERDEPGWHEAVRTLEKRYLNHRVEVEVHTFDFRYNRFIGRVYEFRNGRRGKEIWTGDESEPAGARRGGTRARRGSKGTGSSVKPGPEEGGSQRRTTGEVLGATAVAALAIAWALTFLDSD